MAWRRSSWVPFPPREAAEATCPITHDPIRERVFLHGREYEKTALLAWIATCAADARRATNPLTRAPIAAADIAALGAPAAPRRSDPARDLS